METKQKIPKKIYKETAKLVPTFEKRLITFISSGVLRELKLATSLRPPNQEEIHGLLPKVLKPILIYYYIALSIS